MRPMSQFTIRLASFKITEKKLKEHVAYQFGGLVSVYSADLSSLDED